MTFGASSATANGGNGGGGGWADHNQGTSGGAGGASAGSGSTAGTSSSGSTPGSGGTGRSVVVNGTSYSYGAGGNGGSGDPESDGSIGDNGAVVIYTTRVAYSISVSSEDTSKGTVSVSATSVWARQQYTITATPKTGHHFVRWSDNNTTASRTITAGSDASYTAYFEPNTYQVTFNAAGGSQPSSQSILYGSTCTLPSTTRPGFELVGWLNSGGVKVGDPGDQVTITADVTFTAGWTASEDIAIPDVKSIFNFTYFTNMMRITLKKICRTKCANVDKAASIPANLSNGTICHGTSRTFDIGRGYDGTLTTSPMTGKRDGDGGLTYAYVSGSPIRSCSNRSGTGNADGTSDGPYNWTDHGGGYNYGGQTSYGGLNYIQTANFNAVTTSGVPAGLATAVSSDTVSSEYQTYINLRMVDVPKSMTVQQMIGALVGYTTAFMANKVVTYISSVDG